MKVVLITQRLPKPRGAFNWGLQVTFQVDYSAEEREALNPNWGIVFGLLTAGNENWHDHLARSARANVLAGKQDVRGTVGISIVPSPTYVGAHGVLVSATSNMKDLAFWFPARDKRELCLAWWKDLAAEARASAERFYHDNPPDDGDPEPVVVGFEVDHGLGTVTGPDGTTRKVRRKLAQAQGNGASPAVAAMAEAEPIVPPFHGDGSIHVSWDRRTA